MQDSVWTVIRRCVRAALSARCFFALTELGVPFPCTEQGEFMGYKTDHDRGRRATSAGPYTSRLMTEALEKAVKEKRDPDLRQDAGDQTSYL